jgi:hypothetical protein
MIDILLIYKIYCHSKLLIETVLTAEFLNAIYLIRTRCKANARVKPAKTGHNTHSS